jgi:hypothetical protein
VPATRPALGLTVFAARPSAYGRAHGRSERTKENAVNTNKQMASWYALLIGAIGGMIVGGIALDNWGMIIGGAFLSAFAVGVPIMAMAVLTPAAMLRERRQQRARRDAGLDADGNLVGLFEARINPGNRGWTTVLTNHPYGGGDCGPGPLGEGSLPDGCPTQEAKSTVEAMCGVYGYRTVGEWRELAGETLAITIARV